MGRMSSRELPNRVGQYLSLLLILNLGLAACDFDTWTDEPRDVSGLGSPGIPPVFRILDTGDFIEFYPGPGKSGWRELVDLRLFEGFWPGMSLKQAETAVGVPDSVKENVYGRCWIYERASGSVHVCREKHGSPPFPYHTFRLLRGYPDEARAVDLLHPSVVADLPSDVDEKTVVIGNNMGNPAVDVLVEEGRIKYLKWRDTPGSGGQWDRDHGKEMVP